ncbi:WD40-repeat-containing domain protein [Cytidiella melzeri]|nr:WD40-repeat-containing domain protein [Cytidiella melzeri]
MGTTSGPGDITSSPSFQANRDISTTDEHLQKLGAKGFNDFERRIIDMDRELRNFSNAARPLGGSVGILSSSFHLRKRLPQILHLFRENAADLFPGEVQRREQEAVLNWAARSRRKAKVPLRAPSPPITDIDAEDFPDQLESLSHELANFLECLHELPEVTTETVNRAIVALKGDSKYWASCLKAYEGQFKYPAVQRYLHDLAGEMGEHLDSIASSLSVIIEIGVPAVRLAQKHAAANLLNLSTVATFFSAVTATMLQFSFDQTNTTLANSVNGFWFTSLVFSIGAAVNSLLGLTWKQAMYRSPGHRVPWWVLIWIKRSPLVFLVLSVACFSIGLVLFTYSSGQHKVTSTVTTVFSAFSCSGLSAVSFWFASEKWIFSRHKGQKCLADVLSESRARICSVPGVACRVPKIVKSGFGLRRAPISESPRPENNELKSPISPASKPEETLLNSITERAPLTVDGADDNAATSSSPTAGSPNQYKLRSLVRSVMMINHSTSGPPPAAIRLAALTSKLKKMEITQEFAPHQALVRHLQFSPDGKLFATSSWDRTSVIFRVGDPCVAHRVLAHPQGFVSQVAWSPSGNTLLTKLNRGMKVWTADGVCKRTIDRKHNVQSIAWLPGGEAFLSVEGGYVTKLDTAGDILDQYHLESMVLHDIAVTNDRQRMLCVGTLMASSDGLQPREGKAEKQILVYNMEKNEIENQVPVLHDVRNITLAKDGHVALVSYENKAPPQLWELETVKNTIRLSLRHVYNTKVPIDFAGSSYFGGKNDQLVFCAGKDGDIFLWERESAVLLHHIRPPEAGAGDLTCIAWNHAADNFMFATGSHDGAVRIWTNHTSDNNSLSSRAQSTNAGPTPRAASPSGSDVDH